ncbi:ATP-binding protein [Streptomyces sp. NPDC001165]|uniref:ATP-binding protein n=1 Tax=Streptomyces sp. NPDC001165 TaxID=3364546 RepID=UPI0036C1BEEA
MRRAREAVTEYLRAAGVSPGPACADAVLLVTSELVTNVLRHAPRPPVMDVGITVAAGQLVVSVGDAEPRLPDLSDEAMGAGLRMVAELAADYDGDVSAEPAVDHDGKVVLVRFGCRRSCEKGRPALKSARPDQDPAPSGRGRSAVRAGGCAVSPSLSNDRSAERPTTCGWARRKDCLK